MKPVPFITEDARSFWEAALRHELVLPACRICDRPFYYPRLACPICGSRNLEHRKMSGRGTVYTFSIQYRPATVGFESDPPYITALVDLEEGPRMLSNLVDIEPAPENVRCGMDVEVIFDDVTDEISLPKFRPIQVVTK